MAPSVAGTPYVAEEFTLDERSILRRYFTNLDGPTFALVNLPEVVKGALFARYSRSAKSLKRLFLDEFVSDLDVAGDVTVDATVGLDRAEALYEKVFLEYGDDSVAQLGGVHLACEQSSNVLTKILEWGRLMSYLEQSTRYIAYDTRLGGRYRYYRDPQLLASPFGARYVGDMDEMFDIYSALLPQLGDHYRSIIPKDSSDSDFIYRQAIRAKAFDALRGLLPAASLSNVGIYGTGQGFEQLLLRMRASELPEAREYSDLMLVELRKVIPSFLKRVDMADRGQKWTDYLGTTRREMSELTRQLLSAGDAETGAGDPKVTLVDFDPDGEIKTIAAMLYQYSHLPEPEIEQRVASMSIEDRISVIRTYVGDRSNRRHKPGRALERTSYRFDVLSDYGAFRDLQRHRLLTIEWQDLSPRHGFIRPEAVADAGGMEAYDRAMDLSARLWTDLTEQFPAQAPYAVSLAYRIRYSMQMNAREAMHLIELRSSPQGHPSYRTVAQDMHHLIGDVAGHRAIAEMMRFVDHSDEADLERLAAERRAEEKRNTAAAGT